MTRLKDLEDDLKECWTFAGTAAALAIISQFVAVIPNAMPLLARGGYLVTGLVARGGLRLSITCLRRALSFWTGWRIFGQCAAVVAIHVGAMVPAAIRIAGMFI